MAEKQYKDYRDDIKKAVETQGVSKSHAEWVEHTVEKLKECKSIKDRQR